MLSQAILLAALACGIVGLVAARRNVRGTTLVATWWWSLAALIAAVGVELLIAWQVISDSTVAESLRYAARVLLLCPTISLLGVKRPQEGPWNFIVLSLWGVLALPAAEALFLNTGQPLEVHGFRSWFVLALIFVSLVNTLPTRHWLAALAAVGGQTLLLYDYLPLAALPRPLTELGFGLLAVAAILVALQPPRRTAATSLDHLWLDFRDCFGLFWGLRVQERLLAAGRLAQWPIALSWSGWTTPDGQPLKNELSEDQRRAILITFRGLLRRFVSNEWIDSRLEDEARLRPTDHDAA